MTDFDDLLAKAEVVLARPEVIDALKAGPEVVAYIGAASPDVIRALVLRLREAEADYRAVRADLKAAEAVIKDIQWYVPPLGVDDWQHITEHLYAKAAAYFDTTEGGE